MATEGLTLEPSISLIIDNPASHSWDELVYYWQKWRDASGKVIRGQYSQYVQISNEAAAANGRTMHFYTIISWGKNVPKGNISNYKTYLWTRGEAEGLI